MQKSSHTQDTKTMSYIYALWFFLGSSAIGIAIMMVFAYFFGSNWA